MKTAFSSRSYFERRRAQQDLVHVQVVVEIELDAAVVLEHPEANRVLAADRSSSPDRRGCRGGSRAGRCSRDTGRIRRAACWRARAAGLERLARGRQRAVSSDSAAGASHDSPKGCRFHRRNDNVSRMSDPGQRRRASDRPNVMSLQSHILQGEANAPGSTGDFTWILSALSLAAKAIAYKVRLARIEDVLGDHRRRTCTASRSRSSTSSPTTSS